MKLKYGKTSFEIDTDVFKKSKVVLSKSLPEPVPDNDLKDSFLAAIESSASGTPLSQCIQPDSNTCIIVSDKTRNYGLEKWLELLIEYCNTRGINDGMITVLIATGAHSGHTAAEHESLLGKAVTQRIKILDHDCEDSESLVDIGTTSRGTRVRINRLAAEAPNLIITGVVMPHYYAGFTGGRKSILPGVSSHETIFKNHSLNLAPGGGTHPMARTMVLDGNPIHEDMVEALGMVDVTFSVNVITATGGRPALFFAGDALGAHEKACERARKVMGVPIDSRGDWVIASCGGFPKDISMYQSHKSLDNAFRVLKPGGVLVLLAECSEGLGPKKFLEWFESGAPEKVEQLLRQEYVVMGHTALRILEKTRACKVLLVSSLDEDVVRKIGMIPVKCIEEAIRQIDHEKPGFIIPDAANTVPVLEN